MAHGAGQEPKRTRDEPIQHEADEVVACDATREVLLFFVLHHVIVEPLVEYLQAGAVIRET